MAKTNYSNMSKSKAENPQPKKVEEPKVEVPVTEQTPTTTETKPVEEKVSAPKKPAKVFGVVANCKKLNVRNQPSKNSKVDLVIDAGTKVVINEGFTNDNWFSVSVKGINGYCMKEFISVKS